MNKLYIIGTGGLAKEIMHILQQTNFDQTKFGGYISNDANNIEKDIFYGKVVGDDAWLLNIKEKKDIVIGIGKPNIKQKIINTYSCENFEFPNIIHPKSIINLDYIKIGVGNIIASGATFTCDINVGNFNLFNLNVTIGHDAIIGNNNIFNPSVNISGGTIINNNTLIGTGAQILENLSIANNTIIGAGSVVTKSIIEENTTWVGIPAKKIK